MKKIVTLILLFSLFYTASFAQENKSQLYNAKIKQGSILMGGDLSVSYRSFSTYDENDRNIRLTGSLFQVKSDMKGAYFAFNDFGIGAKLSFDHTNFDMDSSNVDVRRTYLLFGPLVRYYLDNGIFGEASIAGGLLNFSRGDKNDLVEGSVGVGYAYFLNNKV
ncbi:MAG: hypothetical protein LPJ89_05025, partial [Hymenobacteraceae bacterium]|nr:hypothetical protein [Hymenobacteraceae bacterium]MDX5396623.1 hypothetical protein [Hymenobacteraceae bacterium]MDX5443129.1 hypothetical protein [Hymenobacteraceae bacterium]MDX5512685.1 hypothetical protein [Hymenobacteraceae bacterium]